VAQRPSATEALSRIIQDPALGLALLNRKPSSPKALWSYLALMGFRIPRRAVCPGHDAPFDFISDVFFFKTQAAILLAGRGLGKTRSMALLNHLISKFYPGTVTGHVGAVSRQSSWGYEYLRQQLRGPAFAEDLWAEPTKTAAYWRNGSQVLISTGSTETGVSAIRCSRLVMDEVDLWTEELFEMAQQMVSGDERHPSQRIMVSTRYSASGLMSKLLAEAEKRHFRVYRYCLWECMKPCPSCEGESCPLYSWVNPFTGVKEKLCGGRAMKSDGWITRDEAIRDYWATGAREFAVQKLLFKPGAENLIFPEFSRRMHVRRPPPEVLADAQKVAGVDWGWDHPFGLVVWARTSGGTWWALYNHRQRFILPEEEIALAKEVQERFGDDIPFFCGRDEPKSIASWQEAGINAHPAVSSRVDAGLRLMARMLTTSAGRRDPKLFISPECEELIQEFESYSRDHQSRIIKENDDLLDASRYCIESAEAHGLGVGGIFRI